jgi:hypothetical protein
VPRCANNLGELAERQGARLESGGRGHTRRGSIPLLTAAQDRGLLADDLGLLIPLTRALLRPGTRHGALEAPIGAVRRLEPAEGPSYKGRAGPSPAASAVYLYGGMWQTH